jgi:hypothetical protein
MRISFPSESVLAPCSNGQLPKSMMIEKALLAYELVPVTSFLCFVFGCCVLCGFGVFAFVFWFWFFSVQRLHGFRQVVQHVLLHVAE